VLWAYFDASTVRVIAEPGATDGYVWGRNVLRFVRCKTCGVVTHWERVAPIVGSKMGVNARTFSPEVTRAIEVEQLDGAADEL
jgi:hypothetical protein